LDQEPQKFDKTVRPETCSLVNRLIVWMFFWNN
jgi:hypothetical protein